MQNTYIKHIEQSKPSMRASILSIAMRKSYHKNLNRPLFLSITESKKIRVQYFNTLSTPH